MKLNDLERWMKDDMTNFIKKHKDLLSKGDLNGLYNSVLKDSLDNTLGGSFDHNRYTYKYSGKSSIMLFISVLFSILYDSGVDIFKGIDVIRPYYCCLSENNSFTIPAEVKKIEKFAFADCPNLSSLSILGPTSIESFAFDKCELLNDIYMPNVVSIQPDAFSRCSGIKEVTLPNTLNFLGDRAFSGMDHLVINCPAGIEGIVKSARINNAIINII